MPRDISNDLAEQAGDIIKCIEGLQPPSGEPDLDVILDFLAACRKIKLTVNFAVRVWAGIAMDEGASYTDIGDALGITKQSAHALVNNPLDRMMR